MQFCAEIGCPVLVTSGRCPDHRRAFRGTRPAYAGEKWYDVARWKRLRREVIRDQPFCVDCQRRGLVSLTAEVDHVRKHNGDPVLFWDRRNLQGLCKGCHAAKTARGE